MIPFIFVNHFTGMVKKCLYAYLCKAKLRYERIRSFPEMLPGS